MAKIISRNNNIKTNLLLLRNQPRINLKLETTTLSNTKKYRTDILINEQLKYITLLENELKSRHSKNKEELFKNIQNSIQLVKEFKDTNSLNNFDIFNYDLNLSYAKNKIEYSEEQLESNENADELLKLYQRNLIRYEIIKRLNAELVYSRRFLLKSMKTQQNLVEARKRVKWLENEIETILLSNKNIKFPMQRKYEENSTMKIEKVEYIPPTPEPESVDERKISIETDLSKKAEEAFVKPDGEAVEILEFKWDKKSGGSTNSLLESDSESSYSNSNAPSARDKVKSSMSNKSAPLEELTSNEIKDRDFRLEDLRSSPLIGVEEKLEESIKISPKNLNEPPSISPQLPDENEESPDDKVDKYLKELNDFNIKDATIEVKSQIIEYDEKENSEIPFWQMPHNRFEYPHFSRQLVAIDPGSYHRLGLAVTDSYVDVNTEIDGRIPGLDKKDKLDKDDLELLNLASSIENISKKICKSANRLAFKKSDYDIKDTISLDLVENAKPEPKQYTSRFKKINKPEEYKPPPLLPITHLAQTKINRKIHYPRSPSVFSLQKSAEQIALEKSSTYPIFETHPPHLVDQHNLREQTKFSLYRPREKIESFFPKDYDFEAEEKKHISNRMANQVPWSELKPFSNDPILHTGLRFEKIKALLTINLKSQCFDEKKDAIKHLGLLNVGDSGAIYALSQILLSENEPELIKFEASKSLVLLGEWSEDVCTFLIKYLKFGNGNVKSDILKTIIGGKNAQFTDLTKPALAELICLLEETTDDTDVNLSLDASIGLGKIGIKDSKAAIKRLYRIVVENKDWGLKSKALETLVKLFDAKNSQTIQFIMNQIENSSDWIARGAAVKLLSYLGPSVIFRSEHLESIYKLLEKRIAEDPIMEVRLALGVTIKDLMLFERIYAQMNKNLESTNDDVRAKAVVALQMLGVKKAKFIHTLIDMLELDTSESVRTMVLKALLHLAPNNSKVIQAFNNLEKNSKIYHLLQRIREKQNVYATASVKVVKAH